MFPRMNKAAERTLEIPKLSGGMNLRDGYSSVSDDQLTDCKNMWFKNGALRTRPVIDSNVACDYAYFRTYTENRTEIREIKRLENVKCSGTGRLDDSIIFGLTAIKLEEGSDKTWIILIMGSAEDDKTVEISGSYQHKNGNINSRIYYDLPSDKISFFGFSTGSKGYLFVSCEAQDIYDIYEIDIKEKYAWLCSESDITVPLVATNCRSTKISPYAPGGTLIYGYNMISPYYKLEYIMTADTGSETPFHSYKLFKGITYEDGGLKILPEADGRSITAEITLSNGSVVTHKITPRNVGGTADESSLSETEVNAADGVKLSVGGDSIVLLTAAGTVSDNAALLKMVVTAPCGYDTSLRKKVFLMTRSVFFGGAASGLYGGTRLFLGGNLNEDQQSLVIWSDLNDPLYFPENNYAYVGDRSQAVTAFGKQSDMLVIFKEREMFCTRYKASDMPSASDFISGAAVDAATLTAYFPMIQLHGYIGCDCPDTVQLCRNRLVWAAKNGKVYTLVSQDQYNERSVFEVSQMAERRLCGESELRFAKSADWQGHYMLIVKDRIYVMDYNTYGYNYIYSYSKTEDAALHIPWYYWELPFAPSEVLSSGSDTLALLEGFSYTNDDGTYTVAVESRLFYDRDTDKGRDKISTPYLADAKNEIWNYTVKEIPVSSFMQSKLFDFGFAARYKDVPFVNISFGYNDEVPISVCFNTELGGKDEHAVVVSGEKADIDSPEYLHTVRIFPYSRNFQRFGVKISCDGELVLSSFAVDFKVLGGVK